MTREGVLGTTLKTVERALDVLEMVAQSDEALQIKDIADKLDHNLSSTYHTVNTLLTRQYLHKSDRGGLTIGTKIGILSASLVRGSDFNADVRPLIAKLAADSGETVYMSLFIAGSAVIQIVIESKKSLRVTGLSVGYSGLEDRRASGKAVLAHLSTVELNKFFVALHPKISATERTNRLESLSMELAEVRERGYAFDEQNYEPGVCCVAAPFFLPDGTVGGSVAVSAPALRVDYLRDQIRDQVIRTVELISHSLAATTVATPASLLSPQKQV
jgi:IclR family acetate operon transcriptional repressor